MVIQAQRPIGTQCARAHQNKIFHFLPRYWVTHRLVTKEMFIFEKNKIRLLITFQLIKFLKS